MENLRRSIEEQGRAAGGCEGEARRAPAASSAPGKTSTSKI
ncbi:MAG: hypothetical protein ACLSVD_08050 [Eggerthellaceae bacterium]